MGSVNNTVSCFIGMLLNGNFGLFSNRVKFNGDQIMHMYIYMHVCVCMQDNLYVHVCVVNNYCSNEN